MTPAHHPHRTIATVAVGALALALAGAVTAAAVPTATAPPTIRGKARFGERVACAPASWDAPPVAVRYQWRSNDLPLASGRTLLLRNPSVVRANLTCHAIATDAEGQTGEASSAGVRVGLGKTTLKITKVQVLPKGRVRISGVAGPPAWRADPDRKAAIVRVFLPGPGGSLDEISKYVKVRPNGAFTVTAKAPAGRRKVTVNLSTTGRSWESTNLNRMVRFTGR